MSVDEPVEEGEAFRVNFPAASARGVRAHLTDLLPPTATTGTTRPAG